DIQCLSRSTVDLYRTVVYFFTLHIVYADVTGYTTHVCKLYVEQALSRVRVYINSSIQFAFFDIIDTYSYVYRSGFFKFTVGAVSSHRYLIGIGCIISMAGSFGNTLRIITPHPGKSPALFIFRAIGEREGHVYTTVV